MHIDEFGNDTTSYRISRPPSTGFGRGAWEIEPEDALKINIGLGGQSGDLYVEEDLEGSALSTLTPVKFLRERSRLAVWFQDGVQILT